MRYILALIFVVFQVSVAAAQDDKGRITTYLQDALSGMGRDVQIDGFRGALSSRATMDRLTIADDDGVWLILTDAVLDWNRAAVLGGRIEINEIAAAKIELPRLPKSQGSASAEARSFSLPELPVSLRIDRIEAQQVILGAPVIGVPAVIAVNGQMELAGGEGAAQLEIERLEGPEGVFSLSAGYSNASEILDIDLYLTEAADGLTANLLNLPGKPSVALTLQGTAPIDEYNAEVQLRTDGADRLRGEISTTASTGSDAPDAPRLINVDIAGDLTPLFVPQYRAFFGPEVGLVSQISLFPSGRVTLDDLTAEAAALQVQGRFALSAGGLPESFALDVILQDPSGAPVLLPISGGETRVGSAVLNASFDSAQGDAWTVAGRLDQLMRDEVRLDQLDLSAGGNIKAGALRQVTANVAARARGIDLTDPALEQALGSEVTLSADLDWQEGAPLRFDDLTLEATGMTLSGAGDLDGFDQALTVSGAVQAQVADLARFAALAGQPLGGALRADVTGQASLLSGAFDLDLGAVAQNLRVGVPEVDGLLNGESRLDISALRNSDGITLRRADVISAGLDAKASGRVATGNSDLTFQAGLANLGRFVPGLEGAAQLDGRARQTSAGWSVDLTAQAPRAINATTTLTLPDGGLPTAAFDATIASVAWILPELAGPASARGTVRQIAGGGWDVGAAINGPGGSSLDVAGQVSASAERATLSLIGALPLGLANRRLGANSVQGQGQFNLRLEGPLDITSLTGQIRTQEARISVPSLRNAIEGVRADIILSNGRASFDTQGQLSSGGKLAARGQVRLESPFVTEAVIDLNSARITDPQLYDTKANGSLRISGTAPNGLSVTGQLVLDQTDIRVPSTGIASFEALPDIRHVNEPAKVRQTRSYAGLLDVTGAGADASTSAVALDVQIVAQNRIFVRGRGLDAELGGQLSLGGTTSDVIPRGRFELIRGRLDILGKRLTLEEGSVQMQGDLIPMLRLVARTTVDDTVLDVIVEGPADAPEIKFESDPLLPEDEVLARLLFGRSVSSISALQAVQLASAVATLAGRGGVGVIERLRQSTGVDDLDVQTDAEGQTTLSVGKYIGENAYTNVEIDSQGQSSINLNLDLSPSTTLRGQVSPDGGTGIGLFFERDY